MDGKNKKENGEIFPSFQSSNEMHIGSKHFCTLSFGPSLPPFCPKTYLNIPFFVHWLQKEKENSITPCKIILIE
jgi:hypothetical protein